MNRTNSPAAAVLRAIRKARQTGNDIYIELDVSGEGAELLRILAHRHGCEMDVDRWHPVQGLDDGGLLTPATVYRWV